MSASILANLSRAAGSLSLAAAALSFASQVRRVGIIDRAETVPMTLFARTTDWA
jgi:hypothetical protein